MPLETITIKEFLKKAGLATGALLLGVGIAEALTACGPEPIVEEKPVVEEEIIEEEKYPPIFKEKIDIINQENTELADKLIVLYEQKPQVAENLSILYQHNATLVELVTKQPWFNDGINEKEEIFINHGLGTAPGYQGVGVAESHNAVLTKIVEKEQYEIETVELKDGVKNILLMSEDINLLHPRIEILKEAAPMLESLLGNTYPWETITAYISQLNEKYEIINGTIISTIEDLDKNVVRSYLHELTHVLWVTDKRRFDLRTKEWINEGIAEFGAYYAGEKITENSPYWWKWDFYMQDRYDYLLNKAKKTGVWGKPMIEIAEIKDVSAKEFHDIQVRMGYLFMKDLYDKMGEKAFTNMMSDLYKLKSTSNTVIKETHLEEYALKYAPNKEAVQKLFNERVWED